jgi:hypothetical protein
MSTVEVVTEWFLPGLVCFTESKPNKRIMGLSN